MQHFGAGSDVCSCLKLRQCDDPFDALLIRGLSRIQSESSVGGRFSPIPLSLVRALRAIAQLKAICDYPSQQEQFSGWNKELYRGRLSRPWDAWCDGGRPDSISDQSYGRKEWKSD